MANNYFEIVGDETIPCSEELFKKLEEALTCEGESDGDDEAYDEDSYDHGMTVDYYNGSVHMYSEMNGDLDQLPPAAIEVIKQILAKAGRPHWQFGYHYYCDKMRPGEFGGGFFRIMAAGEVVECERFWPDQWKISDKQANAIRCAHADLQGTMQCHEQADFGQHDWKAHQLSINELEEAFPFLKPEEEITDSEDL